MTRDFRTYDDAALEGMAVSEYLSPPERGAARAEIERRRREYEAKRDEQRWDRDLKLAELDGRYRANQMNHETELANKQMAHAEKLAAEQTSAAKASVTATRWAAGAAAASAIAAIIYTVIAVIGFLRH